MKKYQPYFYLAALAILFLLAGLVLFTIHLWPKAETSMVAVEPVTENEGGSLYDLWFSGAELYDLSVDHGLTGILFSTKDNVVSLLDRERKLRWDKVFSTSPQQAKLSSCGNYVVIGTDGGRLLYTSTDQQYSWDDEGGAVDLIAVSPNASWIAVARSLHDTGIHYLELFSQEGEQQWSIESTPIESLYLSSEYLEQANIFYTYRNEETPVTTAVDIVGNILWSRENQELMAVSKHGSRLATVEDSDIIVYDSLGYELWRTTLPYEPKTVLFNPQNYNRLLVYISREGSGENLFYYDLAEDLLWNKSVADGSLFAFTADGQYIVTSSWRHYKEDYTQMILLSREGEELNNWEVAMQVENLAVSGHPHLIVVSGQDGYVDLVNLKPLLEAAENDSAISSLYTPVATGLKTAETKLTLYFIDENTNLVPVTRTLGEVEDPLRTAIDELIKGPARGSALYRSIPDKDVSIEVEFSREDEQLILHLSPELAQMSGVNQSRVALDALLHTISNFDEVKSIYLYSDGEPIKALGEGPELDQPLEPVSLDNPVYVPVMSGNRFYLVIREAANGDKQTPNLEELIEQVLRRCRALPFVPVDLNLLEIREFDDRVQIDMNYAFYDLFTKEAEEHERLESALVLDALFLTVFEHSISPRAEILVEGERWTPPKGFPTLSRIFRQPYYLNPE